MQPVFVASKNKDHNLDSSVAVLWSYYFIYLKPKVFGKTQDSLSQLWIIVLHLYRTWPTGGAHRIWGHVGLLEIESLHFHKRPPWNSHSLEPSAVSIGEGSWTQCLRVIQDLRVCEWCAREVWLSDYSKPGGKDVTQWVVMSCDVTEVISLIVLVIPQCFFVKCQKEIDICD